MTPNAIHKQARKQALFKDGSEKSLYSYLAMLTAEKPQRVRKTSEGNLTKYQAGKKK